VVNPGYAMPTFAGVVLWAEAAREKLPPPTRAAVMMALLGIALVGLLIIVLILLGGHWVRRQGAFRRGRSVPPDQRPLCESKADSGIDLNGTLPTPNPATRDTIADESNDGNTKLL
jgi:hypothetical protein